MRARVAVALLLLAVPAAAWAASRLTATSVRVGGHPAFTRVVVDLRGGAPLQLGEVHLRSPGRLLRDGTARVDVRRRGARTRARPAQGHGVRARIRRTRAGLRIALGAPPRRFKYVRERVLRRPPRLVLDLWRAAPPGSAATVRSDGCLSLDSFSTTPGRIRARGRVLRRLFENALVVQVRNAAGRVVGRRPATAARGRWRRTVTYRVGRAQRGTLEAAAFSAQDGSLDCLAQVPVPLER